MNDLIMIILWSADGFLAFLMALFIYQDFSNKEQGFGLFLAIMIAIPFIFLTAVNILLMSRSSNKEKGVAQIAPQIGQKPKRDYFELLLLFLALAIVAWILIALFG